MEKQTDPDIGPIITLISNKALLQYDAKEGDSSGMRVLLKYQKDLMMKEGMLYRKVLLKGHEQPIVQFVLAKPFRCKTVVCHDDFGDMGMEITLGLLQERFFLPKWQQTSESTLVPVKYVCISSYPMKEQRWQKLLPLILLNWCIWIS